MVHVTQDMSHNISTSQGITVACTVYANNTSVDQALPASLQSGDRKELHQTTAPLSYRMTRQGSEGVLETAKKPMVDPIRD